MIFVGIMAICSANTIRRLLHTNSWGNQMSSSKVSSIFGQCTRSHHSSFLSRCHYLDGGCLSSPRWVSLLVAEIFYPNTEDQFGAAQSTTPSTTAPSVQDFQAYQQYLQKRAGVATSSDGVNNDSSPKPPHCDGHDEIGCFQVRLYYDWFLIPGSCKCWRPDYFAKYVRRRSSSDL